MIYHLGNDLVLGLFAAMGYEPASVPGNFVQSGLSDGNREAVQRALAHLNRSELQALEAQAEREAFLAAGRIESNREAAADHRVAVAGAGKGRGAGTLKRQRKRPPLQPQPLTGKQAEVMQIVGECKGNFTEAARRLGKDRATIKQHYEAAQKKLGKAVVKQATKPLPTDKRGQAHLSGDDDRRR